MPLECTDDIDLSIKFPFFPNLRNEFLKLVIYS